MPDWRELYQELILDHNRRPRNFRRPAAANREAQGFNSLCGDRLVLYLQLRDGVIDDIGFQGAGCAISTASASLLTERLKGKTAAEAEALFRRMHALLTGVPEPEDPAQPELGKLQALAGVAEFPTRVKCATLAWHTLHAALAGGQALVSTEE